MASEFTRTLASRLVRIKPEQPTLLKVGPYIGELSVALEKLADELNDELDRLHVHGTASVELDDLGFRARLTVSDRIAIVDVSQQTQGTSFEVRGALASKFRCPVQGLAQPLFQTADIALFTPAELALRLMNALAKKCLTG